VLALERWLEREIPASVIAAMRGAIDEGLGRDPS
jgi:hypothetical protein